LVGLGLVERRENPSDRRLQTLRLTQKGIETTERLHRDNDVYFGQILKNIPRERRSDVLGGFEILVQASRDQSKGRR
jgi:DNA-binding MarR family transcriptional regulator